MKVKCLRSKLDDQGNIIETVIDRHELKIEFYDGKSLKGWDVRVEPGITGYESAMLSDLERHFHKYQGWTANGGSPVYDRLVIPFEEMERFMEFAATIKGVLKVVAELKKSQSE